MSKGFLRFAKTDDDCRIDGIPYPGIPVFFTEQGIVESASDYMIYKRCAEGNPPSTIETYAYQLQKYLKHLRGNDLDWKEVTDQTLIGWRDKMIKIEGLLDSTAYNCLYTVFDFYFWAEENRRVKNCVAVYDQDSADGRVYQISATRTGKGSWVWSYLPKVKHKPDRNTPTPNQLELVHINAFDLSETGQRDSLILSFYEDVGLREFEALGLTVNNIPSWDEIDEAFEKDHPFSVEILGKGGKKRHVPVLPELMQRAREYIEGDRADAVSGARKRNPAYRPPMALFLSQSTGNELNKQYLSRRLSDLLKASGIQDASGHRVRATFMETQAEAIDGYDQSGRPLPAEQLLWKLAEKSGQSHPDSARPYLNKVRARAFATKGDQILDKTERLNNLQRRLAEKSASLKKVEDLAVVAEALRNGRTDEAIKQLAELLDKLTFEG